MADDNRKLPDDKTTILITKDQHAQLDRIRDHLKKKVDADAGLKHSSFQPTFADALEWTLDHAEKGYQAKKSSDSGNVFGEILAQAMKDATTENAENEDE